MNTADDLYLLFKSKEAGFSRVARIVEPNPDSQQERESTRHDMKELPRQDFWVIHPKQAVRYETCDDGCSLTCDP